MTVKTNMTMALNRYAFAAGIAVQTGLLRNQINKIAAQENIAKGSVNRPLAKPAKKPSTPMNGRAPAFTQTSKPSTQMGEALKKAIRAGSSRVSKRNANLNKVQFFVKR